MSGWLEPGAARMIVAIDRAQQKGSVSGHVAEIGVHHGRLFILLYLLADGKENGVAVDLFGLQHLNIDRSGRGNRAAFLANMRRHADTERLIVHEGDSTRLSGAELRRLAGGPMRLISVDGGHTRETTMHDLETAERALCPGGVIILDDFFSEIFPEVAEGTFLYFTGSERSVVPFAIGANKVMFCGRPWAAAYAEALSGLVAKSAWRNFLGNRVLCLDFRPLSFAERIGRTRAWTGAKHMLPLRMVRRAYKLLFRPR